LTSLLITGFLTLRFLDIVDILLVALLLYQLFRLMRGSAAINIFLGIVAIYVFWKLVNALEMELLGEILGQFVSVGVIALIVVFQKEIRQFLLMLGKPDFFIKKSKGFFFWRWRMHGTQLLDIDPLVAICTTFAADKTGALIVITKKNDLDEFVNTGEIVDARISQQLIENIFFKNSPLHDGAIVISGNRIRAAQCILPLYRNEDFPAGYGLRHRAAVGITELSDAIAIVVSEQTGDIAYSKGTTLYTKIKPDALKYFLEREFEL
jgi:uncharacterized protein (TIGR00159 family)